MEDDEIDALVQTLVRALRTFTGPFGDFIRAIYAAQTDALIDMRSKLMLAGWPEEIANQMVLNTSANMAKAWQAAAENAAKSREKKA